MPLPIGHSLISASVFAACNGRLSLKEDWKTLGLFVFAGLLPDIDFITVPFMGFGSHRGLTHSFLFALIAGSILFLLARKILSSRGPRLWISLVIAMALHPVCDFLTYDYLVERGGVRLFYPFSDTYYQSPLTVFVGIELRYLKTIFSAHTLFAIFYEAFVSGAVLSAVLYLKRIPLRSVFGADERGWTDQV